MFKSRFPAILKVQTMFTFVFGPNKHTCEVRFRVKTMPKKFDFFEFLILFFSLGVEICDFVILCSKSPCELNLSRTAYRLCSRCR